MLDNIDLQDTLTMSLTEDLLNFLDMDDDRQAQLQFLKILRDNQVLELISKPTNNIDTLNILIRIGYAVKNHGILLSLGAQYFAVVTAMLNFSYDPLQLKIKDEIISGRKIAAFAATEMDAGSDIMGMQTLYQSCDGKYMLNGKKYYITNATTADYILVFATQNPKLRERGLSLFVINRDTPGVTIEPLDTTQTLKNSGLGNIELNNVMVDPNRLLGKELQAAAIFNQSLKLERSYILIPQIGTMLRWHYQCIDHIKNRTQFRKPLFQFQSITDKIIDMHEKIKISHLLARDLTCGKMISDEASSFIKNYISDALQVCHQNALSILGASGLFGKNKIAEDLAESFSTSIYSGTKEIQKNIILNFILDDSHDHFS